MFVPRRNLERKTKREIPQMSIILNSKQQRFAVTMLALALGSAADAGMYETTYTLNTPYTASSPEAPSPSPTQQVADNCNSFQSLSSWTICPALLAVLAGLAAGTVDPRHCDSEESAAAMLDSHNT